MSATRVVAVVSRVSRVVVCAVACAAGGSVLAGCSVKAQPVRAVGLNRNTPKATYEYMVAMVGALQTEAEWQAFSPGFKRRLSESAGRNVDYGDYSHARATIAGNDKQELKLFLESEYVGETFVSEKEAIVTIRAGSKQLRPRMVRLSTWELTLQGENQPVSGFIGRMGDVVGITPDGNVQVRVTPEQNTASFLKDIPPDRIESVSMKSEWFLEDFGEIEDVVRSGLRGGERGERTEREGRDERVGRTERASPHRPPTYAPPSLEPAGPPPSGRPAPPPGPGATEPMPVAPHPGSPDAGDGLPLPPPPGPTPGSPDG